MQTISSTRPARGGEVKELDIRVLTPAFYSRFVHYAYTSEAFDRECIFTDEKNRTCWVSRPKLLAQLLSQCATLRSPSIAPKSSLHELKWLVLKKLRCAPAEPAYNATPNNTEFRLEDIRVMKFSELDAFVRQHESQKYSGIYRRMVTKLFLAQRFCLGFPQVITLCDWAVRSLLCYCAASYVSSYSGSARKELLDERWWPLCQTIAVVSASHAYGLLKGYR